MKSSKLGATVRGLLALSLVVVFAVSAIAAGVTLPKEPLSGVRITDPFGVVGCNPCRVQGNTTAVSCASAAGRLAWVCAFGTAVVAGKGVQAFDTSSTLGAPAAFNAMGFLSPIVYGTQSLAGNQELMLRCWEPKSPAHYSNGLMLKADDTSVYAVGCYRPDADTNP